MAEIVQTFNFRLPKFDFEDNLSASAYCRSVESAHDSEKTLVGFNGGAVQNAESWSSTKKLSVVGTSLLIVLNSAIGSSLPGGTVSYTTDYFHVTGQYQLALPITVFLVGYIFGPLAFSPLSEIYGRRVVLLTTFAGFTISTVGCALAASWLALLIFRFFAGLWVSAPYTLAGGICADVYSNAAHRGRAIMALMICLNIGPAMGPIISGFVAPIDWRWNYWIALMIAAVSWIPLLFLPETYAPVLEARRNHATPNAVQSPDLATLPAPEKQNATKVIKVALIRPFRLFAEPIVIATSSLMALVYAIFYLFFEAYPIIFGEVYGMSAGVSALAFIPMPIGACLDMLIVVAWDRYIERSKRKGRNWVLNEDYRRIPLACLGGPLCALSLFWLGWSARPTCHWLVPMLAGVPYGMGVELTFMSLTSVLCDGYGTLTASALASAAISRSICGALLPLLARPLYGSLGVSGASSLLGGITLVMATVPFGLLRYGGTLRKRSKLCSQVLVVERKHESGIEG